MSQPQQEWNEQYQRWVMKCWDEHHQRHYWKHYVEGQGWVFFGWCPQQRDSVGPFTAPTDNHRGRGQAVHGTYNVAHPAPNSHYEPLDPAFFVRPREYYQVGRMFSILFTEPAGSTRVTGYNDAISYVRYREAVHTQVRRFIVVFSKREFCYAVPIFTYGNQGTKKQGVVPSEHAIAYSYGCAPTPLAGEEQLQKQPICIVTLNPDEPLSIASRIYFGIAHPIQYNVKVKDLGYVLPDHIPYLIGYYRMENQALTNQAGEINADAFSEGSYGN